MDIQLNEKENRTLKAVVSLTRRNTVDSAISLSQDSIRHSKRKEGYLGKDEESLTRLSLPDDVNDVTSSTSQTTAITTDTDNIVTQKCDMSQDTAFARLLGVGVTEDGGSASMMDLESAYGGRRGSVSSEHRQQFHGFPSSFTANSFPRRFNYGQDPCGTRLVYAFMIKRPSRLCCLRIVGISILGVIVCISVIVTLVIKAHMAAIAAVNYSPSMGPRGAVPQSPPSGPSLPVLGAAFATYKLPALYFGVSIDWRKDDPQHFNSDLGHSAAIHNAYFFMNSNSLVQQQVVNSSGSLHTVSSIFNWTAGLIRGSGAIMSISVIPTVSLDTLTASAISELASQCMWINQQGIPVLLQFAPQMNGNWFAYGQDPVNYVAAFRNVSQAIRNVTNMTAMVWTVASGLAYPFPGGVYQPLATDSSSKLTALDTNADGKLSELDDPYLPYWPGETSVDWIGMSIFYTSPFINQTFFPIQQNQPCCFGSTNTGNGLKSFINVTAPSSLSYFFQNIPVNAAATSATDPSRLESHLTYFDFYNRFSNGGIAPSFGKIPNAALNDKIKPILLGDFGTSYFQAQDAQTNTTELTMKQGWYMQLFNSTFINRFINVRGVIFLNQNVGMNSTSLSDCFNYATGGFDEQISSRKSSSKRNKRLYTEHWSNSSGGASDTFGSWRSADFRLTSNQYVLKQLKLDLSRFVMLDLSHDILRGSFRYNPSNGSNNGSSSVASGTESVTATASVNNRRGLQSGVSHINVTEHNQALIHGWFPLQQHDSNRNTVTSQTQSDSGLDENSNSTNIDGFIIFADLWFY